MFTHNSGNGKPRGKTKNSAVFLIYTCSGKSLWCMQIVRTWYVRFAWYIEKMAAIGREEEALLLLLLERRKRRNKRRQRRVWVHEILQKRKDLGEYHKLVRELHDHGHKFYMYFRMSHRQFSEILALVENAYPDDITRL